jgi:hypothetical protein
LSCSGAGFAKREVVDLGHAVGGLQIRQRESGILRAAGGFGKRPRSADSIASWVFPKNMHVVGLLAPRLEGEDHPKGIDFAASRVCARWQAWHDDTRAVLERVHWTRPCDPMQERLLVGPL